MPLFDVPVCVMSGKYNAAMPKIQAHAWQEYITVQLRYVEFEDDQLFLAKHFRRRIKRLRK